MGHKSPTIILLEFFRKLLIYVKFRNPPLHFVDYQLSDTLNFATSFKVGDLRNFWALPTPR